MLAFSEACERNKRPIYEVLTDAFADRSGVLEVGSGTGQHAVYFARRLGHLRWTPTDLQECLPMLRDRLEAEGPENVSEPLALNVHVHPWLERRVSDSIDAVFTANTLHIISWFDVEHFFEGVGTVLDSDGVLCIYGPFRYNGQYTSESNARFDQFLRQRDPSSGIRDIEAIAELAEKQGFRLDKDYAMPANNQLLVWVK